MADMGWLWHGLGGAAITGLGVTLPIEIAGGPWWVPLLMPPPLLLGGYVRERWQHDWAPLNPHRWWEAAAWGIGGLLAALIGVAV